MNCYFLFPIQTNYNRYYLLYHSQRIIHMKGGHLIGGITLVVLCALLVQGAAAGAVERSIEPAGISTYRVVLALPGETVAGITEILPPGMEVREVSLPAGQYRINGTTLFLAVIGEREITYFLQGPENPAGALRGTWTDYLSGHGGTVGGDMDGTQGPGIPPAGPVTAGTPRAGPSLFLFLAGTGIAMACAARCRARGRDE